MLSIGHISDAPDTRVLSDGAHFDSYMALSQPSMMLEATTGCLSRWSVSLSGADPSSIIRVVLSADHLEELARS